MEIHTNSPTKTQEIGRTITNYLDQYHIICLYGDLGAGKTQIVQGLAQALGVTDYVTSPTFTLCKQYPISYGQYRQLLHIDLYRLEDNFDIRTIGIEEAIEEKDTIVAIEWAEKMKKLQSARRLDIIFSILSKDERLININAV